MASQRRDRESPPLWVLCSCSRCPKLKLSLGLALARPGMTAEPTTGFQLLSQVPQIALEFCDRLISFFRVFAQGLADSLLQISRGTSGR